MTYEDEEEKRRKKRTELQFEDKTGWVLTLAADARHIAETRSNMKADNDRAGRSKTGRNRTASKARGRGKRRGAKAAGR